MAAKSNSYIVKLKAMALPLPFYIRPAETEASSFARGLADIYWNEIHTAGKLVFMP